MPSASRIRRSIRLARSRASPRGSPCPTKICVMPCLRANSRIACTGSPPSRTSTRAPAPRASSRFCSSTARSAAFNSWRAWHDVQLAVEAVGLPPPAADHQRRARARRDADQDPLVGAVHLLDPGATQVLPQLLVDHLGGEQQRDLAQLRELALEPDHVARGRARTGEATQAVFGRGVDDLDLVRGAQERLGDGVGHRAADDRRNLRLLLRDELEVDRRDDRDAGREHVLDVLPALRVTRPRRVAVGEPVDQHDLGAAMQHGADVDRLSALRDARRDDLELAQQLLGPRRVGGLRRGHHDVLASLLAPAALVEHPGRLADSRGVAEEHLEVAPLALALLQFETPQELLGARPSIVAARRTHGPIMRSPRPHPGEPLRRMLRANEART